MILQTAEGFDELVFRDAAANQVSLEELDSVCQVESLGRPALVDIVSEFAKLQHKLVRFIPPYGVVMHGHRDIANINGDDLSNLSGFDHAL